jgi:hypothetical protein
VIAVVAQTEAYRAAVAELPLRTRLGDRAADAVVVVPGETGWVHRALVAAESGARAIVVADPEPAPVAELRQLAERIRVPLVIERPLLRTDAAHDATDAAARTDGAPRSRAIVLDGGAPAARLHVVARDAIGWGRVLAGQAPVLRSAARGLALLEGPDGIALTLSVVATRRPGRGWIRAQVLGEVLTDVDVEGRSCRIAASTVDGQTIAPTRFESSERLAVRRAIEALEAGAAIEADERPGDLADLISDTEPVEQILRSHA